MINSLPPYILYLLAIAGSFVVSLYAVRKIIFITRHRRIFDIPDNTRKIHGAEIPSLGGIGIFVGYIVIAAFFMFIDKSRWNYILISSVILFFTGIYDDLMNMRPLKKLLAQLIASAITVFFVIMPSVYKDPRLYVSSFEIWSVFTVLTIACTFFINAFNFIDGIDGLACVLSVLYTAVLGILFAINGEATIAAVIFSLAGATLGLLYYNRPPAKIYMGDTGSMLIGFNIFIFSILYLLGHPRSDHGIFADSLYFPVLVAVAILFFPAFDAVRVFILRLSKGISPLKADRTHLHYYLLDAGFSHSRSVLIITIGNVIIISLAFILNNVNPIVVILLYILVASIMLAIIYRLRQKKLSEGLRKNS